MNPTKKKKVRTSIELYCNAAAKNEPNIHYSQQRPFTYLDNIGFGVHTLDCSGFVGNCYWNAKHDTKIYLEDPLNCKYTGVGYTGTMETYLRSKGKRVYKANGYLVGDIAMFNGHTMICSKEGTAKTSKWTSHGQEAGPNVVALHYRSDLVGVWRHPALI
jgi:hypothetical protein